MKNEAELSEVSPGSESQGTQDPSESSQKRGVVKSSVSDNPEFKSWLHLFCGM